MLKLKKLQIYNKSLKNKYTLNFRFFFFYFIFNNFNINYIFLWQWQNDFIKEKIILNWKLKYNWIL